MDKLSLKPYDANAFDKIAFGNEDTLYPHAQGLDNFIEQLLPYFPNERQALQDYVKSITTVGDHFPLYRLRMGSTDEKAAVSRWSLNEKLRSSTPNVKLQNVLAGNNLLYAGVRDTTPFYLHALVTESYIHSSHKVLPGSSQISKYLWQVLQQHGGVVHRNTEVKKLAEEHGSIQYAETADGARVYGKHFIANVAPAVLLDMIDSSLIRPAYRNRIKGLQQTISTFMLNLVLKLGTVPMRHHNIYWHASDDVWAATDYKPADWPANYAAFFTEDEQQPGYAESLSVLSYMHYDEVLPWMHTTNRTGEEHERGEAYEAFKRNREEKLLNILYQRLPELKGNIQAQSSATPLTYRDYTATPKGSLYGILKDVNRPNETTIATRTRISNLLLTGQNVNMHGVLGVSITAVATAAELVGMEYLLNKIKS
jgi:all-trans-retinol 13,14-reductase